MGKREILKKNRSNAKEIAFQEISKEYGKNYLHIESKILTYCKFANKHISIDNLIA